MKKDGMTTSTLEKLLTFTIASHIEAVGHAEWQARLDQESEDEYQERLTRFHEHAEANGYLMTRTAAADLMDMVDGKPIWSLSDGTTFGLGDVAARFMGRPYYQGANAG